MVLWCSNLPGKFGMERPSILGEGNTLLQGVLCASVRMQPEWHVAEEVAVVVAVVGE